MEIIMFTYKIYTAEEVIQVEKKILNEELLYDIFQMHPDRTVYITESGIVAGIVTLGDFKRYIRGKNEIRFVDEPVTEKKLINTKFTSESVEREIEIFAFLKQKKIAFSVPVLDEQGKILREYSKEKREEKKSFDVIQFLSQVYKETEFFCSETIYILIDQRDGTDTRLAEMLKNKRENVHIITYLPVSELKQLQNQDGQYIYDCRYKFAGVASYFCKNYRLNYFHLASGLIHMLENIENLFAHFVSVGILDNNQYFKRKSVLNIQEIAAKEFVWNSDFNCYEYKKANVQEKPEVIYTVFPLSENPYVRWKTFFVPLCAMFQSDANSTYDSEGVIRANDNDIALNIIPKLERQGVKCIVLDNVQSRYSGWREKLGIDPQQAACKVCYNQMFQTIEKQNRWVAIYKNGYIQLADVQVEGITYRNGERCPEELSEGLDTIYIFGPCVVWGGYVSDNESIGYLLRKRVGRDFNVKAYGVGWNYMNYTIREHEFKPGDSVVIFAADRQVYDLNHIPVFDIMDVWKKVMNLKVHIRDLPYHCDGEVTRGVEEKVFQICESEGCFQKKEDLRNKSKIHFGFWDRRRVEIPQGMRKWLVSVQKEKIQGVKKTGAIVMNCNPFTKGHRYLIEESAKKVDVLYIFVVEENKSFFSFEDRIEMVRLGISDIENVVVIPSGKYIISSETLPGYFEKDENNDLELDATQDLDLFGGVIAKEFEIVVRFAGDEPEDAVTRQYNQQMKSILPVYGVEFMEIPRKKIAGKAISASSVRKYIKEQEYGEVRKLVLPQVYDYLREYYFK